MRKATAKLFFNTVGILAVALGVIGIFLPLVPTTPFLLLASACFMRGSERLHRWLLNNKMFGEYIRNIEENRGIPLRGKIYALVLMWVSMATSIYIVKYVALKVMLAFIGIGVSVWILRMKTLRTERSAR